MESALTSKGTFIRQEDFDGRRLRVVRKAKDIPSRTLASLAGLDKSMVSRIETGKQKPTPEVAELLARTLKVDLSELLRDASAVPPMDLADFAADPGKWLAISESAGEPIVITTYGRPLFTLTVTTPRPTR